MSDIVFLDRDGLINRKAPPHEYITQAEAFHLLPGVAWAIRRLNEAGYLVIVVTNQRGVARGKMRLVDVEDVHRHMEALLRKENAHVDDIFVCPHNTGECQCRKPDTGLFLQAKSRYSVNEARSWMVGDSPSDAEFGHRCGLHTIQTESLAQAVDTILSCDAAWQQTMMEEYVK